MGAGPAGLASAIELQRAGLQVLLLERGCVAHTLTQFPTYMRFFTSADGLELGDVPFGAVEDRPGRTEAVRYYQQLTKTLHLRVRQYEEVRSVVPEASGFLVHTSRAVHAARTVVLAIGSFYQPLLLGIPGESQSHVMHHYREPHAYFGQRVVIVGGRNSAGAAAVELFHAGALVTLVHRRSELTSSMKPWLREELCGLIARGQVEAYFDSHVVAITPQQTVINTPQGYTHAATDFVFALTGYQPDFDLLRRCGVRLDEAGRPILDPETLETTVEGLYLAGVVVGGRHSNQLNISHAREHAKHLCSAIVPVVA